MASEQQSAENGRYYTLRDVMSRMDKSDDKLDAVQTRLDRLDGAISMVKWLGPGSIVAVIVGVAKASGLL